MCDTCGCNNNKGYTLLNPSDHSHHSNEHGHGYGHGHPHEHGHAHEHGHTHEHDHTRDHYQLDDHDQSHNHQRISIETDVLHQNNLLAERNRGFFDAKNITCLNLVSSPGSGKTTLLEKTILKIGKEGILVIEGDQQTSLDADRILATGARVIQINTGNGCHLDADMINKAVKVLNPPEGSVLMIENVGNLVCPALFDLGEKQRVVIMSVTEGEDKPLKYPNMFQSAHLCLINKTDLIPYVGFDMEKFRNHALKVNPQIEFIALSAKTGEGVEEWSAWINKIRKGTSF